MSNRTRSVVTAGAVALLLMAASSAFAHFVWIETQADGVALLVRSGFGEPDGWDPDLISRIKQTKYWVRTGGSLKPLEVPLDEKEKERRTKVEGPLPTAVLGSCDYGVIGLGGRPATWLRYTAKNLVGPAPAWTDREANPDFRIEVMASLAGNKVKLQVLHLGKPLADATVKATPPSGETVTLTTDSQGQVEWPLSGAGRYGLFVGTTIEKEGKLGDKTYVSMKDYATLTFEVNKSDAAALGK